MTPEQQAIADRVLRQSEPEVVTWKIAGVFFLGLWWRAFVAATVLSVVIGSFCGVLTFFAPALRQQAAYLGLVVCVLWPATIILILKRMLANGVGGYRFTVRRKIDPMDIS